MMAKNRRRSMTKAKTGKKRVMRVNEKAGDTITVKGVGAGAAVAAGRGASAKVQTEVAPELVSALSEWRSQMEQRIDDLLNLSAEDKKDLKEQAAKVQTEATKGKDADPGRLEKLLNTLAVMSSDILDVAIATLANPLGGIGLVLKKVGDKARVERQSKPA
jgi:hypothetical protein